MQKVSIRMIERGEVNVSYALSFDKPLVYANVVRELAAHGKP